MTDVAKVEAVGVSDTQADPSHPEHQRWVKETLVRDDLEWMRSLGLEPTAAEVDRKISGDLQRLYARKRDEGEVAQPKPKNQAPKVDEDPNEVARSGGVFRRALDPTADTSQPFRPPKCGFCGVCKPCARNRRVAALVATHKDDLGNTYAEHPVFARQVMAAFWFYRMRIGPFLGIKSQVDRDRLFTRIMDDVCDRSNSTFGTPWWT